MGNIWITGDTHFGHTNIIKYCDRPFKNVEDMDTYIIDRLNHCVGENDVLYHLGDFSYWHGNVDAKEYRSRIRCRNVHLIVGNHDYKMLNYFRQNKLFSSISDLGRIKHDGKEIVTCHYAMRVWNKSHYGVAHAYGHSHGTLPDDPNALSMDVGVDPMNFCPISWDQFWHRMSLKNFKPIDHHGEDNAGNTSE